MSDLTSPLGGDDLAKALRDAHGQGYEVGLQAAGIEQHLRELVARYEARDAWIAQYMARLPAAEPIAAASEPRVGEDVGPTERQSEAPIYEAFARFVGDADERPSDFRMFATGYHAAAEALKPSLSRKVDANIWKAAEHLNETQRSQPEWLWFVDDRTDGIPVARYTFGRWAKLPEQAPYVRADLALASAPSPEAGAGGDLGTEDDAEIERIMSLSSDELRFELAAEGHDPDRVLENAQRGLDGILRLAADRKRWRDEAASWRRVAERLEEEKQALRSNKEAL